MLSEKLCRLEGGSREYFSYNHLRYFKRAQLAIVSYSVLPQASDSKQHQKIQNTKTSFLDMKTLKVIFVCILMPFFVLGSESGKKTSTKLLHVDGF